MQTIWFWIVSVMVAVYAMLDGFDFGAGALHLLVARTNTERRQVLGAIGPWWDGNEVWLLAAGGALFLAFPRVLGAGFSGFYLALFFAVWTLLLRGIGIEFRSHLGDGMWRSFWDLAFSFASALMPVLLGAALGNVIRGVPLDASGYFNIPLFTDFSTHNPVGILDWYTVLTGIFALVVLCGHGALFLAMRTQGPVYERSARLSRPLWLGIFALWMVVTAATYHVSPHILHNLPSRPLAWVSAIVLIAGIGSVAVGIRRKREVLAFVGSSMFIVGLLAVTAACVWPTMLPSCIDPSFSLTALNASSSEAGLKSGVSWWVVAFPIAVSYFVYLARVHRDRVQVSDDTEGY